jgi:hypothetical protein
MSLEAVGRAADSAIAAIKRYAPAVAAVVTLAAGVATWRAREANRPPVDPMVQLGRSYAAGLGETYASAWNDGAAALEAGKSVPDALGVVAGSWQAGRVALFDKAAAPAFARIVPESAAEADVTVPQKAALAAAWRSFASGLKNPASGK